MEPTKEPLSETRYCNADAPETPYEQEMFEAMFEAERVLVPVYAALLNEKLGQTEAKSRGVLLALNRLLANHLVAHCSSMLLPRESLPAEVATLTKNIEQRIEEHYDAMLTTHLAKETKQ